jgi:hypothetical protein
VFVALALVPVAVAAWVLGMGRLAPDRGAAAFVPAATAPTPRVAADPLAAFLGRLPLSAKTKAPPAYYSRDSLFDYLDGGAPAYLDKGFARLGSVEVLLPDGADFTLDVYDMGAPTNAASLAFSERTPTMKAPADWPEASAAPGVFYFPSSQWYVKLTSLDEKSDAALEPFARALRGHLP